MAQLSTHTRVLQLGLIGLAFVVSERLLGSDVLDIRHSLGLNPESRWFAASSAAALILGLVIFRAYARRDLAEKYRRTVLVGGDAYRLATAGELSPGLKANFDAVDRNLGLFFIGFEHPAFRPERLADYAGYFIATSEWQFAAERRGAAPEGETPGYLEPAARSRREDYPDEEGNMIEGGPLPEEHHFACQRLSEAVAAFSLVEIDERGLSEAILDQARRRRPDIREAITFRRRFWQTFAEDIRTKNSIAAKIDLHGTTAAAVIGIAASIGLLRS